MKILAWILGSLSVLGTITLGADWIIVAREAKKAVFAKANSAQDEANSVFQRQVVVDYHRKMTEIDRTKIEAAQIEIDRATLKGRQNPDAERDLMLNRARLLTDEDKVETDRFLGSLYLTSTQSQGNTKASNQSLLDHSAFVARYQSISYGLGVVWLAFGLACALAVKK